MSRIECLLCDGHVEPLSASFKVHIRIQYYKCTTEAVFLEPLLTNYSAKMRSKVTNLYCACPLYIGEVVCGTIIFQRFIPLYVVAEPKINREFMIATLRIRSHFM